MATAQLTVAMIEQKKTTIQPSNIMFLAMSPKSMMCSSAAL